MALAPMLVSPAQALPDGPGWAYEVKHDGLRALVVTIDGGVRLRSRHGVEHTHAFPELAALGGLGVRASNGSRRGAGLP